MISDDCRHFNIENGAAWTVKIGTAWIGTGINWSIDSQRALHGIVIFSRQVIARVRDLTTLSVSVDML